jgi:hypothetical protein
VADIRDFGAVGDTTEGKPPGTPCAGALQAAVRALDRNRGGDIYLPYAPAGGYYFEQPVLIDRPVYIHGAGRSHFQPATRIYAAAGVTPFIFLGPSDPDPKTGSTAGSTGFIIETLNISSLQKNPSHQPASFSIANPDQVTVQALGDFTVNQVVRVGGAGERQYYNRTKVNTHKDSNVIDGAMSDVYGPGIPGLQEGMWIRVLEAHPYPVKVAKANQAVGSYTLVNGDGSAANASATHIGAAVQYCDDLYGRIRRIDPVNKVFHLDTYADANNTIGNGDHLTTEVTHASCGIYARAYGCIRAVFAGHSLQDEQHQFMYDLEGCGVLLFGDHGRTPVCNVNGWRCEHILTYGCQHGLKVLGIDANAGTNAESNHLAARSWAIIDYSFLGNVHINPQMQGGTGIITRDNPNSRTIIIGPYNEGGTVSNFGLGTDWHGGTIVTDPGGWGAGMGRWNRLYVGDTDGAAFECLTTMEPARATDTAGGATTPRFLNFQMTGGAPGGLTLRKIESQDVEVTSIAVNSAKILTGGTGYQVNDVLVVVGGIGTPAKFRVTKVDPDPKSGSPVTEIVLTQAGSYTQETPSSPNLVDNETTMSAAGASLVLGFGGFSKGFQFEHGFRVHPIIIVDDVAHLAGDWANGAAQGDLVLGQGFWLWGEHGPEAP